jgi:DNA-binding NarL/FixJ family response regulator
MVYRSKLDAAGGMVMLDGLTDNTMMTSGTPVINEDMLCLYIDLDRLIERASLSPLQQTVVTEVMKGYSITDIAEELTVSKQLVATSLSRAADKIAETNNRGWEKTYADAPARKRPDLFFWGGERL